MKSEVKETLVDKQIPYPKLMVATDGEIVLFMCEKVGVVVGNPGPYRQIGYYISGFSMDLFKDFHGTVTLSN